MRRPFPDSKLPYIYIQWLLARFLCLPFISWFLENPELNWTPPQDLLDFIEKARSDGKALVYIGFGSITVPNPKLVTDRLVRAVQKSTYL